jgi:amino acid transporter
VSSRTLFIVAQNYGTPWMRNFFGKTNDGGTPQNAIIFTSAFGLVGLLGIADTSFNQPVLTMSALFTGGVACVYAAQCWAFFNFKAG